MADQTIGSLPAIVTLDNESLFVAEQQGAAGKVTGAQITGLAGAAAVAAQAAQAAAEAAQAGAQAAESAIENLAVEASTLPAGQDATVQKTLVGDACKLSFGLPRGAAGSPGADGTDGVSPTVAVAETAGGHTVSITDAGGTSSFAVLDGLKPFKTLVTLTAAGWVNGAQTVQVPGVLAEEGAQLLLAVPTYGSVDAYYTYGVLLSGQSAGAVTFSVPAVNGVSSVPENLSVYVLVSEVRDGL